MGRNGGIWTGPPIWCPRPFGFPPCSTSRSLPWRSIPPAPPDTDTDLIAISYTAAKWPIQQANNLLSIVSYGEGVHNIGLTFSPVPVELCEPVVFVYSIVNCGNSDSTAVMATMQKSGADYIDTALKSLPNATNSLIISAAETGSAAILGSLLGPRLRLPHD
jgi:hypothetical protein